MDESIQPEAHDVTISDTKLEAEKLIQILLLSSDTIESISSDPQFTGCVENLLHLSLDELAATPKRIKLEEENMRAKTEQLAVENYHIFLANADTSRDVHGEFKSISSSNETLLRLLTKAACSGQRIFDNILEFLELPQLMETCVQNGYYQDALNILVHTEQMNRRHGHNIPVIRIVALQSQEISIKLFNQLCYQLRQPITLPVCLKVVIYLRQLEAFTEQELRLNFLQARGICIQDQLGLALAKPIGASTLISPGEPTHLGGQHRLEYAAFIRAMRRIEVTRVQLFDSITQYRAVFADEEIYNSRSSDSSPRQLAFSDISPLNLDDETSTARRHLNRTNNLWSVDGLAPASEASLFHAWILRQITLFLAALTLDLEGIFRNSVLTAAEFSDRIQLALANDSMNLLEPMDVETAFQRVHSLMTQAFYFGKSFARIGCDFRGHLHGIFAKAILRYFEKLLANAFTEFDVTLELWPWEIDSATPSAAQADTDALADPTDATEIEAPLEIARHPAVAFFCNRLLTALNGLRVCCPIGLKQGVVVSVVRTLHSAAEAISEAYAARQCDDASTRRAAARLASCFTHLVTPHLLRCLLEHLFGGDATASLWQLHATGTTDEGGVDGDIIFCTAQRISREAQSICQPLVKVWGHQLDSSWRGGEEIRHPIGTVIKDSSIQDGTPLPQDYTSKPSYLDQPLQTSPANDFNTGRTQQNGLDSPSAIPDGNQASLKSIAAVVGIDATPAIVENIPPIATSEPHNGTVVALAGVDPDSPRMRPIPSLSTDFQANQTLQDNDRNEPETPEKPTVNYLAEKSPVHALGAPSLDGLQEDDGNVSLVPSRRKSEDAYRLHDNDDGNLGTSGVEEKPANTQPKTPPLPVDVQVNQTLPDNDCNEPETPEKPTVNYFAETLPVCSLDGNLGFLDDSHLSPSGVEEKPANTQPKTPPLPVDVQVNQTLQDNDCDEPESPEKPPVNYFAETLPVCSLEGNLGFHDNGHLSPSGVEETLTSVQGDSVIHFHEPNVHVESEFSISVAPAYEKCPRMTQFSAEVGEEPEDFIGASCLQPHLEDDHLGGDVGIRRIDNDGSTGSLVDPGYPLKDEETKDVISINSELHASVNPAPLTPPDDDSQIPQPMSVKIDLDSQPGRNEGGVGLTFSRSKPPPTCCNESLSGGRNKEQVVGSDNDEELMLPQTTVECQEVCREGISASLKYTADNDGEVVFPDNCSSLETTHITGGPPVLEWPPASSVDSSQTSENPEHRPPCESPTPRSVIGSLAEDNTHHSHAIPQFLKAADLTELASAVEGGEQIEEDASGDPDLPKGANADFPVVTQEEPGWNSPERTGLVAAGVGGKPGNRGGTVAPVSSAWCGDPISTGSGDEDGGRGADDEVDQKLLMDKTEQHLGVASELTEVDNVGLLEGNIDSSDVEPPCPTSNQQEAAGVHLLSVRESQDNIEDTLTPLNTAISKLSADLIGAHIQDSPAIPLLGNPNNLESFPTAISTRSPCWGYHEDEDHCDVRASLDSHDGQLINAELPSTEGVSRSESESPHFKLPHPASVGPQTRSPVSGHDADEVSDMDSKRLEEPSRQPDDVADPPSLDVSRGEADPDHQSVAELQPSQSNPPAFTAAEGAAGLRPPMGVANSENNSGSSSKEGDDGWGADGEIDQDLLAEKSEDVEQPENGLSEVHELPTEVYTGLIPVGTLVEAPSFNSLETAGGELLSASDDQRPGNVSVESVNTAYAWARDVPEGQFEKADVLQDDDCDDKQGDDGFIRGRGASPTGGEESGVEASVSPTRTDAHQGRFRRLKLPHDDIASGFVFDPPLLDDSAAAEGFPHQPAHEIPHNLHFSGEKDEDIAQPLEEPAYQQPLQQQQQQPRRESNEQANVPQMLATDTTATLLVDSGSVSIPVVGGSRSDLEMSGCGDASESRPVAATASSRDNGEEPADDVQENNGAAVYEWDVEF